MLAATRSRSRTRARDSVRRTEARTCGRRAATHALRRASQHQPRQPDTGRRRAGEYGNQGRGDSQLATSTNGNRASGDRKTSRVSQRSKAPLELRARLARAHQPGHSPDTRGLSTIGSDGRAHELLGSESPANSKHARVSLVFSRARRTQARDRGLFTNRAADSCRLVAGHRAGKGSAVWRGLALRDRKPDVWDKSRRRVKGPTRGCEAIELWNHVRTRSTGSGRANRMPPRRS